MKLHGLNCLVFLAASRPPGGNDEEWEAYKAHILRKQVWQASWPAYPNLDGSMYLVLVPEQLHCMKNQGLLSQHIIEGCVHTISCYGRMRMDGLYLCFTYVQISAAVV